MIQYRTVDGPKSHAEIEKLKEMASDMPPHVVRQLIQRDGALRTILVLPGPVLDQALAIGRALLACAEHQRKTVED